MFHAVVGLEGRDEWKRWKSELRNEFGVLRVVEWEWLGDVTLEIDGEECYNKYNQELYVPKALCILSLKPFFSCHTAFLKWHHAYTPT